MHESVGIPSAMSRDTSASATRPVVITGSGMAVPGEGVTAEEFDRRLGLEPGKSQKITGVRRRFLSTSETASKLAARAVEAALCDAGTTLDAIDCLVCASATMDQALPYNAAMTLAELSGDRRLTTVDIGASCLSFIQALDLMSCAIAHGRHRQVVIVSADISTFTTDPRNLRENGFFGDGAAAVVLGPATTGTRAAILASHSLTLPQGVGLCQIRSGGSRYHRRGDPSHADAVFEMRGPALFAMVARVLPGFLDELFARAGLQRDDIHCLIPHQASRRALDLLPRFTGIDAGRMTDIFADFGNQVAASLPTALHLARTRGELKPGQRALLLGSGAGVSLGGIILVH